MSHPRTTMVDAAFATSTHYRVRVLLDHLVLQARQIPVHPGGGPAPGSGAPVAGIATMSPRVREHTGSEGR